MPTFLPPSVRRPRDGNNNNKNSNDNDNASHRIRLCTRGRNLFSRVSPPLDYRRRLSSRKNSFRLFIHLLLFRTNPAVTLHRTFLGRGRMKIRPLTRVDAPLTDAQTCACVSTRTSTARTYYVLYSLVISVEYFALYYPRIQAGVVRTWCLSRALANERLSVGNLRPYYLEGGLSLWPYVWLPSNRSQILRTSRSKDFETKTNTLAGALRIRSEHHFERFSSWRDIFEFRRTGRFENVENHNVSV